MLEEFEEIDDEETERELFEIRQLLLEKDSLLESIAQRCKTFEEFKNLIEIWFKDDTIYIPRVDLEKVWDSVQKADDLVNMRNED